MRNIILFTAIVFPALLWGQQQDCKETPADLASKTAVQVDTTRIIDPNTYEETVKLTHIYHMGEMEIVDRKTVGNRTYFYVEKNDCLVIRHVSEMMK